LTPLASRQEFQARKPWSALAPKDLLKKQSPAPAPEPFPRPDDFLVASDKKQRVLFELETEKLAFIRVSSLNMLIIGRPHDAKLSSIQAYIEGREMKEVSLQA
jgi:hypothetical protein